MSQQHRHMTAHLCSCSVYTADNTGTRVPGFLSSRPNWLPPSRHPQRSVAPPPFGSKGGRHTRLRGRGWRGPNCDEGIDTLVLYVYYNPSTVDNNTKIQEKLPDLCTLFLRPQGRLIRKLFGRLLNQPENVLKHYSRLR
jgi:hypothetical protein